MDFRLSEQEKALRDLARDFARETIKPRIADSEWVMPHDERMPWDLLEAGSKIGLRTLTVPKEYGGPDEPISPLAKALITEELSVADPGVASFFTHAMREPTQIDELGTKAQKDWFFPEYVRDDRYLTAVAGSEPEHGSDWVLPIEDFRFNTTAVLDGDEWVINGEKYWITCGADAKIYIVYACTDPSKPFKQGTTMFLVPREAGVRPVTAHEKVGMRFISNANLVFENVRIPKNNVLGEVNGADKNRQGFLGEGNLLWGSIRLGIARAAYEDSLDYARMRVQGGKPIVQHQAIGAKLVEMYSVVEAMRALIYHLAWQMENPAELDPKLSPMLLWYGQEACFRAATLGMQICGSPAKLLNFPQQKHLRDMATLFGSDGTHTVQMLKVMRLLGA